MRFAGGCPVNEPGKQLDIEVFFDGDCSVCGREVEWLRQRDTQRRIQFTDIAAPGFDAGRDAGIPIVRLLDCIQARLSSGEVLEGMDVFRHLYGILGYPRLVRLTRLPIISPLLDGAYRLFAKNRLRLTGRSVSRTCTAVRMPR
jgi:predicted DCC family thiol-disulfide oxidoreductase YuxK